MKGPALALTTAMVSAVLPGCAPWPGVDTRDPAATAPAVMPAPFPPDVPAALAQAVLADASARTGLPREQWVWLEAEAVTWSDGSLGCPQPGRLYTQALVPGWRLVLRGGQATLPYHASQGGAWVHCPPNRARPPAAGSARQ